MISVSLIQINKLIHIAHKQKRETKDLLKQLKKIREGILKAEIIQAESWNENEPFLKTNHSELIEQPF